MLGKQVHSLQATPNEPLFSSPMAPLRAQQERPSGMLWLRGVTRSGLPQQCLHAGVSGVTDLDSR